MVEHCVLKNQLI